MKVGLGHDEGPATRCVTGPSGFEASAADGLSPQPTVVLATSHIRTARIARAREHPRPLSPASSAPHKSSDREAEVGHASRPTADHSRPSLDPPQSPRPSLIFFAPVDGAVHRCSVVTETLPSCASRHKGPSRSAEQGTAKVRRTLPGRRLDCLRSSPVPTS